MSTTNDTEETAGVNTLSLEKAALYYSKYARVFPLQPNTKMPLLPGSWTSYATQDPITIISWWQAHPTANIAMVADDNLTIIDLDIKDGKDGVASFRKLIAEFDLDISGTPIATTTSGGKHVFYKHPNESHPGAFHNGTNKGEEGGIDVRSGHAYVVVAPSVVNGNSYAWPADDNDPLGNIPLLPETLSLTLDDWGTSNVIDISKDQPELLKETLRHDEHPINQLPAHLIEFALRGTASHYQGDGSAALMGLASRLYILGLDDAEVLTFLANYPGPSNIAFKRRQGSFEAAVSWLWKYSCIKARKNKKMSSEEAASQFLAVSGNDETVVPTTETPALDEIKSIDDFDKVREIIKHALTLAPLEQGFAISQLKDHLKGIGVQAKPVDKEIKAQDNAMRAETPLMEGGPVFAHLSDAGAIRATTMNFQAVMKHHGIGIRHNTMSHEYDIFVPGGATWLMDTELNDQRTLVRDLLEQYGMSSGRVDEYVSFIGGQDAFHPTLDMLATHQWDGVDRVTPVLNCLNLAHGDEHMRDKLVTTWLMSALTVVRNYKNNPPRGVLVLAGPQHCGKTSFFRLITPEHSFGEGLHLDVHDKDSLKKAVKYWIVELGELDATFKKSDIAALKAHISNTLDEIRLPYAAKESRWQRRTVYGATVNRVDFLQDQTGNTRFWPVEVNSVDIDTLKELMAGQGQPQFWAQLENMREGGQAYMLNQNEVMALENHNDSFREIKIEEERLDATFDWTAAKEDWVTWMTTSEIAAHCGMKMEVKGRNPLTEPLQRMTAMARPTHKKRHGKVDRCWRLPPLKTLT